jgi:hypothetical protein
MVFIVAIVLVFLVKIVEGRAASQIPQGSFLAF